MSFRLINPSKSHRGKISKNLLDKINKILILNTNVNQWKNTPTVIDLFKNVANKKRCSFIQFDAESFYVSISLNLFNEAIQYASTITEISDSDKAIMKYSREALLFHNNQPWEKKSGDPDFDVLMGCYYGAEICEFVEILILNRLSNIIDKNSIGLYRDDGIGMFKQLPKSISKRLSKNLSSKEVFDKSKTLYERPLNNSGFYENLIYHQGNGNKNQHKKIKKCQPKIIWFNPPFSKIVKTNIDKKFLKSINRHFQKTKR